jgi:hypothetical protein
MKVLNTATSDPLPVRLSAYGSLSTGGMGQTKFSCHFTIPKSKVSDLTVGQ